MKYCKYGLAGLFVLAGTPALAQGSAGDEAQKQATRLISQAISERVSRTVDLGALQDGPRGENSSSAWVLGSYTDIGFGGNNVVDLYLGTAGYDRSSGDLVYGISGTYTHAAFGGFEGVGGGSVDGFTLSPYAAYKIGEGAFVSGIFNLAYSSVDGADDPLSGSFEVAVNGFGRSGAVTGRAKLAYRGAFGIDPSSDISSTLVAFAEAEVPLAETVALFVNAEANAGLDDESDAIQTYGAIGLFIRPSERSQFGLGYQRLLTGRGGGSGDFGKLDVSTFTLQYRTVF